jgi:acetyl-CoA acyltransferase
MAEAWIVDAVRTPVGRAGGALSSVRPDDLAALVLARLLDRTQVPPGEIEDVLLGCANQAGEDNRNVARMALLLAGWPETVPGVTVNRLCGSGMEAVAQAARAIAAGEGHAFVAGGVESMSRAPWALAKPDRAFPRGNGTCFDTSLGWRFVNPSMEARGHTDALGITAENVAREQGVDRAAQDRFALASHRRAVAAEDAGAFARERVPVATDGGEVSRDEGPRRDTSLEKLAALRPAFREGGTVTAGNSSPLNDGAAALLLVSGDFARAHGLRPLARVRSSAVAGVPPRVMGMGPVPAGRRALERAGLAFGDLGRIELNEAFAAQVLADLDGWGVDREDPRVNPDGGAIALGHPLGCSGARILTTLVHGLQRGGRAMGLAAMCIGVGQGIAMAVERIE